MCPLILTYVILQAEWLSVQSIKTKVLSFRGSFITDYIKSLLFDNFRCSQWRKFNQNENTSVSLSSFPTFVTRGMCHIPTICPINRDSGYCTFLVHVMHLPIIFRTSIYVLPPNRAKSRRREIMCLNGVSLWNCIKNHCCRDASQISDRSDNFNFRSGRWRIVHCKKCVPHGLWVTCMAFVMS